MLAFSLLIKAISKGTYRQVTWQVCGIMTTFLCVTMVGVLGLNLFAQRKDTELGLIGFYMLYTLQMVTWIVVLWRFFTQNVVAAR